MCGLSAPTAALGDGATTAKAKKLTRAYSELLVAEKVERVYRRTVDGGMATANCHKVSSHYYDCEYSVEAGDAFGNGFDEGRYGDKPLTYGGTGSVKKARSGALVVRVSRPR